MPPIPCHIIAGPLGVGKTTAILHHLHQYAPAQRVGVLVNDFGPVGLDSATLKAEAPTTKVLNVPGGCICCTMLAELPKRIQQLTSEQAVDRLIIEPSGMAAPAHVINLLKGAQGELNISLQPTVAMLSAVDFDEDTFENMAYYRMFCEAADVLVFNRCDQANPSKIQRAQQWAQKLDPPKLRVAAISHGQLPLELFAFPSDPAQLSSPAESAHTHNHDHGQHSHNAPVHPGGFVLAAERQFDLASLQANLQRICAVGIGQNQILRLKGVICTSNGWQSIEIANHEVIFKPSTHRIDNRMEWLTQPEAVSEQRLLEEIQRPLQPA